MLMATDIRLALDPALIGERVGLQLDPWQTSVVRERPHRGLWLCSRQSGKTTTALLMTLWTVLYEAPALVLIVSPSQRQSGEAFRSFMQLYHRLDGAPELRAESALRAELSQRLPRRGLAGHRAHGPGVCRDEAYRDRRSIPRGG